MKTAFDDVDDFNKKGGLKAMGESPAGLNDLPSGES